MRLPGQRASAFLFFFGLSCFGSSCFGGVLCTVAVGLAVLVFPGSVATALAAGDSAGRLYGG